jgi:hypothetical protein
VYFSQWHIASWWLPRVPVVSVRRRRWEEGRATVYRWQTQHIQLWVHISSLTPIVCWWPESPHWRVDQREFWGGWSTPLLMENLPCLCYWIDFSIVRHVNACCHET